MSKIKNLLLEMQEEQNQMNKAFYDKWASRFKEEEIGDWDAYREEEMKHDEAEEKRETKVLTISDVRKILAEIARDKGNEGVKSILTKHGANKLSEVKPEDYEAILIEVGELYGK